MSIAYIESLNIDHSVLEPIFLSNLSNLLQCLKESSARYAVIAQSYVFPNINLLARSLEKETL